MTRSQILELFDRYLLGKSTLNDFEECVLSNLQTTLDAADESAIKIINEADVLLMQLRNGSISEGQLMEELNAVFVRTLTLPLEVPAGVELAVGSGNTSTIHAQHISESVVRVELPGLSAP